MRRLIYDRFFLGAPAALLFAFVILSAIPARCENGAVQEGVAVTANDKTQIGPEPNLAPKNTEPDDNSNGVMVREVPIENVLKTALQEQEKMRQEKQEAEARAAKLNNQINLYAEKIRILTSGINSLEEQLKAKESSRQEEKEAINAELDTAKREKDELKKTIASLEIERDKNKYYKLWKDASEMLKKSEDKLKMLSRYGEKMKQENGKMHYNMANICFEKGEYEKAAYEYEKALKLLPGDSDTLYNLAIVYDYYLKNSKKAQLYYTRYLSKNPDDKKALHIKEKIEEKDLENKIDEPLPK